MNRLDLESAMVNDGNDIASHWTTQRKTIADRIRKYRAGFPVESGRNMAVRIVMNHLFPNRHQMLNPCNPSAMVRAYRNLVAFARGPIPGYLPCGADDAYGERQYAAGQWAAEIRAVFRRCVLVD